MANHAIGIDLGTTFSCVAVCKKGRVEVFENDSGSRTTPSYVAFTEHERIIGNEAKNHVSEDPTNTVFEAKRLIGRKFNDREVQGDMIEWPFTVFDDNGDPKIEVTHMGQTEIYTPPQISAMVLEKMKEIAEEKLGEEVKRAVITVPAYFNDSQRQATKDAARIAGLNVMKLINEPTAAAIAFAVNKKDEGRKNVLVYDLGGGTFDVSVLIIDKGAIEVKAVNGDTHLGGSDFDQLMVEHFLTEIESKYGKNLRTEQHKRARLRLRQSCEAAKKSLTKRVQAVINIDSLFDGRDYRSTITKAKFEEICDDLFQKTLIPVERALNDAKLDKDQIDEIVLVGGSTKIPKIQSILQEFFNGKPLNKSINPDEAVAYGAAIQAAVMEGDKDEAIAGIHLLDVTPLSYGTDVVGDMMDVLIPRNTSYPVTVTEAYLNGYDNQTEMLIQVLQGEYEFAKDATKLKEFQLTIPPMPRAKCTVNVCFDIDEHGILNVSATELSTGAAKKVMIQNIKGQYTEEQINQMIEAANRQRRRDLQNKARIVAKNSLESFCFDLRRSLNGVNAYPNANQQQKTLVRNKAEETLFWVAANPAATQEQIEAKTREIRAHKDSLTN